jgi:signal transduction histidine kinase
MTSAAEIAVLALVYFLAGKLGLSLAFGNTSASPVWPATGIALAALLVRGSRLWPGVFVGAFLVNFTTAGTILTSLGIATGNTLEAALGAWLVLRLAGGVRAFEHAGDTLRFVIATLLSAMASATVGLATLYLGGLAPRSELELVWLTWWLGDSCGGLILAPALILWAQRRRWRWDRDQVLEGAGLLLAILIVAQSVFGFAWPVGALWKSLKFLCLPLLVWAALRFDLWIAASSVVLISTLAVVGFLRSSDVATGWSRNQDLVLLQIFMAISAISTMALAAVVAERSKAALEARRSVARLREAMTELEAFHHSMSHDLRTPIGTIQNFVDVLELDCGDALGAQGKHYLQRIRVGGLQRIKNLLEQLSEFSRVGQTAAGTLPVDMTELARAAYAEVQTGMTMSPQTEFHLAELPPGHGNAALLGGVFRNLLRNAVKFTSLRETPRVEVGGIAGREENTYFVADNGVGFRPEFRARMFHPFQRAGLKNELEGSGLGLAIVAKIVRNHGGRVWAESDGVTGAKVYFTLPNGEVS